MPQGVEAGPWFLRCYLGVRPAPQDTTTPETMWSNILVKTERRWSGWWPQYHSLRRNHLVGFFLLEYAGVVCIFIKELSQYRIKIMFSLLEFPKKKTLNIKLISDNRGQGKNTKNIKYGCLQWQEFWLIITRSMNTNWAPSLYVNCLVSFERDGSCSWKFQWRSDC
jgi:hypothetical protein